MCLWDYGLEFLSILGLGSWFLKHSGISVDGFSRFDLFLGLGFQGFDAISCVSGIRFIGFV